MFKNAIKNFNAIPKKTMDEEGNLKRYELRKMLLSVTLMHATVSKKEQFGPLGWSRNKYVFAQNDFDITVKQIVEIFNGLTYS